MQNLEEPSQFVSNYKKEIKYNLRLFQLLDINEKEVISSKHREISQLLQKSNRLKKEWTEKIHSWQKSNKLIHDTVNNDEKFIRVETCSIINEINFSISPKNKSKLIYEDKFSTKKKTQQFCQKYKTQKIN